MKLLYLTFQEDAPLYLGVTRKIRGQASAFQKLGYEVTYTLWREKTFCFCGEDRHEVQIGPGRVMKQFSKLQRTMWLRTGSTSCISAWTGSALM